MTARRLIVFAVSIILVVAGSYMLRSCQTKPQQTVVTEDPAPPLILSVPDNFHYLQKDSEWVHGEMGSSGGTIGDFGCTLSSVAMAASNLGIETNPGELNAALNAANGYTERGWLRWAAVEEATRGALRVTVFGAPKPEQIDRCLQDGHYPVVKFMLDDRVQHWALVVGKMEEDWVVRDPLDETRTVRPLGELTSAFESVRCIRPGDRS